MTALTSGFESRLVAPTAETSILRRRGAGVGCARTRQKGIPVSQHDHPQTPESDPPEPEYEPPRAEEIVGEDRAATASWVQTGFQPPD